MARKYDYLTKEIAYPIIARYFKNGGGLPSEFYKKEGLSDSQFYTWRKRYLEDFPRPLFTPEPASKDTPASFHPIQVSSPITQSATEKDDQIELEYPNGVILRVGGSLNDSRLASLIKLY